MSRNGISPLLLLFGLILMSASCSLSRKTTVYTPTERETPELSEKSAADTFRLSQENLEPVDISDYKPPFMRDEEDEDKPLPPGTSAEKEETPDLVDRETSEAPEVTERSKLVSFGKQFLGTPYKYAGKTPDTGFDCSGFTSFCYKEIGKQLSGASRYQAQEGKKIPLEKAQAGDLIFFEKGGKINHVAMVVKNTEDGIFVIHSTSRGVVIDNISISTYWKPKIKMARTFLE